MSMPERITDAVPGVALGDPEVIKVLEDALSEARAGRLCAVALAKVTRPGQVQPIAAGGAISDMYLGCGLLQRLFEQHLMGAKRSPIMRPM